MSNSGYARDDFNPAAAATQFQAMLAGLAEHIDFPAVLAQLRDSFIASHVPAMDGQMRQLASLDRLTIDSRAVARPDLIHHLDLSDEILTITFSSNSLTLPGCTAPSIAAALDGNTYRIGDLPGPLDDDGKLILVRRLIREGLMMALNLG